MEKDIQISNSNFKIYSDDELSTRNEIKYALSNYFDEKIIGIYPNKSFSQHIKSNNEGSLNIFRIGGIAANVDSSDSIVNCSNVLHWFS